MSHEPVLLNEAVAALAPRPDGCYVDATFGGGGYSRAILAAADCSVIAFDRDPDAVARAQELARTEPRFRIVAAPFGDMADELQTLGVAAVDGVVFDLGVSSFQLDDPARGFSFRFAGPLDMRMSRDGPSAADLLATLDETEITGLLRRYGDEPDARRIARAIVADRRTTPFLTTDALAGLVARVKGRRPDGRDPATLTFQALRMAVNDELGELERGLEAAESVLRPGGRLVVVSFHSGEDALVKRFIDERGGRAPAVNRHQPVPEAGPAPRWRVLSRKVALPDSAERARNPRARSGRLRLAVRLEDAGEPERERGEPWPLAA